ncbi:MAG: aromatic amino acid ammonia-lyase [Saprospiraceae bacterium]|nr:aromatic amino acid ammonia-lyase [Saprospiraceae bacterium]
MVIVGGRYLHLTDFERVLFHNEQVELDKEAFLHTHQNYLFLKEFSADKLIYGINTGFGPMAQYKIADQDQRQLQYNLIRSHSSGMGQILSPRVTKAVMLARLNTLMLGYSGIPNQVMLLLQDFINQDISPLIFEHGGVGASGDLVQLAHLALTLIGEGEVVYQDKRQDTATVLKTLNLQPIDIQSREGLALMNGTSCMTGLGLVNLIQAKQALDWSLAASILLNEIVESYDDHFSPALNYAKHHEGQRRIAEVMHHALERADLIKRRSDDLYTPNQGQLNGAAIHKKVQEYYSLRCIPQILGPVYDSLEYAVNVLENELNSVNDNPVIDKERGEVYHGGNFHGDYVALEMDKLKIVMTKMSMLAERQLNFLLNHKINEILPPFINQGILGLNFGIQGTQFTATSTTAENQSLATSSYIHSIPNNNDNQDIVSMGTNAAVIAQKIIQNTFQVLAIEWLALIQAVDYLKIEDKLSTCSKNIYRQLKQIAPPFVEDQVFYKRNEALCQYLQNNKLDLFDKYANPKVRRNQLQQ